MPERRSSRSRHARALGLDDLRSALDRAAGDAPRAGRPTAPSGSRSTASFSLRGIGTVVTGTLWSGSVGTGDRLVIQPGGREARVRSVQVHDRPAERAAAGQRVALALVGVERAQVGRGHVVTTAGAFPESFRLQCDVAVLESAPRGLRNGEPVVVHHGTAELHARVAIPGGGELAPGAAGRVQLRLRSRAVAAPGDHVVIRLTGPAITVAGGTVIDPDPPRVRRAAPERRRSARAGPRARAAVGEGGRGALRPPRGDAAHATRRSAPTTSGRSRTSSPPAGPSAPGRDLAFTADALATAQAAVVDLAGETRARHAGPAARPARHLAEVRPGPPRGARRTRRHAPGRRRAHPPPAGPRPGPDLKHRRLAPMFHRSGQSTRRVGRMLQVSPR